MWVLSRVLEGPVFVIFASLFFTVAPVGRDDMRAAGLSTSTAGQATSAANVGIDTQRVHAGSTFGAPCKKGKLDFLGSCRGVWQRNGDAVPQVPHSVPAKFEEDRFSIDTGCMISGKHNCKQFYPAHDFHVSNFTGRGNTGPCSRPGSASNLVTGDINGLVKRTFYAGWPTEIWL